MLHELLLALSGHPGDIFVPSPASPSTPTTYVVAEDFPFLHPAERTALNRLARLGFLYSTIRAFVDRHRKRAWNAVLGSRTAANAPRHEISDPAGLYLLALCSAVDAVFDEYFRVIVQAESKILSSLDLDTDGGRTPVSVLEYMFGKYQMIFPHLNKLLKTIDDDPAKFHGTRLLNFLHAQSVTGFPDVRAVVLRLFQACMAVFYKQLVSWMLYGKLHDPHREFFVRGADSDLRGRDLADDELELHLQAEHTRWESQFTLDNAFVPTFIPPKVAETILFIGKAVVTIKESKRPQAVLAASLVTKHLDQISSLSESSTYRPLAFETAITRVKKDVSAILWDVVVMDEHLLSHLKAFKNCYLLGSGALWMEFIEECAKLKMKAGSRLSLVTDHELNTTFRTLLRQTNTPDTELYMEHFRFRVVRHTEGQSLYTHNLLGVSFKLDYIVKWPLDLVFTQGDFEKYNQILSFLLHVKSTHMRLQRVCTSISQLVRLQGGSRRNQKRNILDDDEDDDKAGLRLPREVWMLRGMMMFFLDCFWAYVQMDVLESSYYGLVEGVGVTEEQVDRELKVDEDKETGSSVGGMVGLPSDSRTTSPSPQSTPAPPDRPDFDQIRTHHTTTLDHIIRGLFLDPAMYRLVGKVISQVLNCCDKFCGVVDLAINSNREGVKLDIDGGEIENLKREFEEGTEFLFRTFEGVERTSGISGGGVGKVLLRMDFNRWYSLGGSEG